MSSLDYADMTLITAVTGDMKRFGAILRADLSARLSYSPANIKSADFKIHKFIKPGRLKNIYHLKRCIFMPSTVLK